MHRTDHTRIERPNDVLNGGGCRFALLDRRANQRLLQRAGRSSRIARREVPGGRRDDLVAVDRPAF